MKKYLITYISKGKIKHININAACIASSYVIAALNGIDWDAMLNSKLN